jgi:hypothetical protein
LIVEYDLTSAVTDKVVTLKSVLANSPRVTLPIEDVICRRVVKGIRFEGIAQRNVIRGAIATRERGREGFVDSQSIARCMSKVLPERMI